MVECDWIFSLSYASQCTVARNEYIFFTVEGQVLIEFMSSPIRYSNYTVANLFLMLVDNRLTSPVRNGTVLGVGMTLYTYAYTTQMANFIWVKNYENSNKLKKKFTIKTNEE